MINGKKYSLSQILSISGNLVAIGIVVNILVKFNIQVGSASLLRISFGWPFVKFAAVLFGPLYGGIAGALTDFLGHMLYNPSGGDYLWPMMAVEFMTGRRWACFGCS